MSGSSTISLYRLLFNPIDRYTCMNYYLYSSICMPPKLFLFCIIFEVLTALKMSMVVFWSSVLKMGWAPLCFSETFPPICNSSRRHKQDHHRHFLISVRCEIQSDYYYIRIMLGIVYCLRYIRYAQRFGRTLHFRLHVTGCQSTNIFYFISLRTVATIVIVSRAFWYTRIVLIVLV